MMLTFIGIGSAFNTELGNTSAWMKNGTRLLILDCGGSVFERILKSDMLKDITTLDICLTHTHGDHVGSLGDLVLYCSFMLKIRPTLRHPETVRIRALLTLFGVTEDQYVLEDSLEFALENWLEGRFIPQEHVDTMPAYGILFKLPKQSCWYSGDSKEIPSEILDGFLRNEIDNLYQDTSGSEYPGMLHMSLGRLENLIPEPLRKRVVCMHQDEAFSRETAENLGFRVAEIAGRALDPGNKS